MLTDVSAASCVMLKPSELVPASQDLPVENIPRYLHQGAIQVVTGAARETFMILERRLDHIFNTGSTNVAEIARRLTWVSRRRI